MEETDDFVAETGIPVQPTILTETVAITTGLSLLLCLLLSPLLFAALSFPVVGAGDAHACALPLPRSAANLTLLLLCFRR